MKYLECRPTLSQAAQIVENLPQNLLLPHPLQMIMLEIGTHIRQNTSTHSA